MLDCPNERQKEDYEEAEANRPQEGDTSEGGETSYEGGEEEVRAEGRKKEGRGGEAASEEGARG